MADSDPARISGKLFVVAIGLVALAALASRLSGIDLRPMHGDEANQAYKTGVLLETGRYEYDPHDHHGPTLYYLAAMSTLATGKTTFAETTEFTYRVVPVLFSVALILLLIPARSMLGAGPALASGVLLLVSPAFVFYSRYFIQETLLVFFTFGAIVACWKYVQRPGIGRAVIAGVSISLMHATKETAIIAYTAMVVSGLILAKKAGSTRDMVERIKGQVVVPHLAAAALAGGAISIVLFSAFFTHARGPLDSILTYGNYLGRAGGAGIHDKPPQYYLSLLLYTKHGPGPWWSEGFILLMGLVGLVAGFRQLFARKTASNFLPFLAIYTAAMTIAYALIPYKTPWSALGFYHGIVLLAGYGIVACIRRAPGHLPRIAVAALMVAGCAHLAKQTYAAETRYPADPRNPYVYAHTSSAMLRLAERAEGLSEVHPEGKNMRIHVIQPDHDYWPIPWYLRGFPNVGFFGETPETLDADLYVVAPELGREIGERLGVDFVAEVQGLRPGVLRTVYIRRTLWEEYLSTLNDSDSV